MSKKWTQTKSEYVGKGHPDRVADDIANIINKHAMMSATEVLISKAGLFITGETTFDSMVEREKAINEVNSLVGKIVDDYEMFENLVKRGWWETGEVQLYLVHQDEHLSSRRQSHQAGDQEVVFHTKLDENDIHYWLRKWDNHITDNITSTLDYKILVDVENNYANISISTSHCEWDLALEYLEARLCEEFGDDFIINIVKFRGGTFYNDTGVTGRKLIVEQAGCGYPHGGGAVYGKDITKTAPYAHKLAREFQEKNGGKTIEVIYKPGDDLDKPSYIGEWKGR